MTFAKKLLGVVFLGLLVLPLHAVPTVFHCTESAGPGDVIGLQGDSFGATPQVWIELVTPGLSSLAPSQQLTTISTYINGTVSYVSAQIPTTETAGLYAVWVYDGSSYCASPSFINKARAFGAQDLCGTQVDANRSFRLFGRNMYFAGSTPSVSFVNGSTTLPATVTTTGSDANTLYVKAPAGLVSGTVYTVNVQNGYGGTWGQGSLSYTLTARTSASDPFGLGVPWGADFAAIATNVYNIKTDSRLSIHAVGDGVTNDAPAIQNAINVANGAGGGVVYFPAGTYEVTGPTGNDGNGVSLYSGVVLEGAGATQSTIQVSNATAYGFGLRCPNGTSRIGFYNIGFDNSTTGCAYGLQINVATEVFALNSQFQAEVGKQCVFTTSYNVLVEKSTFITDDSTTGAAEQVWLLGNTDQIFKNNTVSWYFSRVRTGINSVRSLIEGNNLTRNAINNSVRVESGGFDISESDSTIVLNNVITKGGTGPLTQNNDGETIMAQNDSSPNSTTGTATGATSTTLIDTTKDWTFNYAYSDTNAGQLYYVAIVKGPGTGQIRQVIGNTTTSLTIATPWAILPTSSSNYTLNHAHLIHSLIKGNSLTENTQGIELYKDTMDDVTITGNTLTDNGSIWLDNNYRNSAPNIFTVQMDTTVTGNNVSNTLNWYTETGSYAQIFTDGSAASGTGFGTNVFGTEFRDNTLTAPIPNRGSGLQGEGYLATLWGANDPTLVGMLGVIFDGNTAANTNNAYQLNTWDYNTTIWDYSDTNVSNFLLDVATVSHASVDTAVSAQLIGIQTYVVNGANGGPASQTLTPSQTAGVIPQNNFNTINALGSTLTNIVDSAGGSTTIGFTMHDGGDNYGSESGTLTPLTANDSLLSGQSGVYNATSTYTFTNVPAGTYNVVVYTVGNSTTFVAPVELTEGTTSGPSTYYDIEQDGANFNGTFIRGTATTSGTATVANYVEFLNVSPVGGQIQITVPYTGGANYVGINGLQLEANPVPEQSIGVQTYVINGANGGPASQTLTTSQIAGVIPQNNFNTIDALGTSLTNLLDSAGGSTTVGFTMHDGGDNYGSESGTLTPLTANDSLLSGQSGVYNATSTYTFTSVPAGTYNVVVYTVGNSTTFLAPVELTVGATTGPTTYYDIEQDGANFNGTFIRGTATTSGTAMVANYVEFLNVTPVGGQIQITVPDNGPGDYVGINGLQLEWVP